MTVVWVIVAFLAGAFSWHYAGGWLFKKFGMQDEVRQRTIRGISTDALLLLHQDAERELQRRRSALNEIGDS